MGTDDVIAEYGERALVADPEAASCYRWVRITQVRREASQRFNTPAELILHRRLDIPSKAMENFSVEF